MSNRLTSEERADLRAGCDDNATHFNGSANVGADTVLKAMAYILELELRLEAIDISYDKKMHWLVMQVDSADWAAAELEAENKALRAATEKALRRLLFRPQIIAVLSGEDKGRALAHNDNIHEAATKLNITLD